MDSEADGRHDPSDDRNSDEQPAALDRVRRDVAELGADAASAPDVPAHVTARIVAALRAQPPPPAVNRS